MLRHGLRCSSHVTAARLPAAKRPVVGLLKRTLATQSGDDAKKPTALAKIYLEDGTVLTGRSFGSHEAVEGEVCIIPFRWDADTHNNCGFLCEAQLFPTE